MCFQIFHTSFFLSFFALHLCVVIFGDHNRCLRMNSLCAGDKKYITGNKKYISSFISGLIYVPSVIFVLRDRWEEKKKKPQFLPAGKSAFS